MKTPVISNLQDSSPVWENICHNLPQANSSWSLKAKKKILLVRIVTFFSLFLPANYHSGGKYKSAEYMDHEAEHTPLTMVHLPARAAWESRNRLFNIILQYKCRYNLLYKPSYNSNLHVQKRLRISNNN